MRPRRTRRYGTSDRGVSAIIFAMLLSVIILMSAFAIDIGAAYTERRHDQNTADAAVMSGAVEAVLGGEIDKVVKEVRAKVDTTLGRTVTDEEWEACQDDEQLALTARELAPGNPLVETVTDCISFNTGFDQIRVKLPEQDPIRVFAPALGVEITVDAAAEAEVIPGPGAGAPPFIAFEGTTKGDFVCLRTSSAQDPVEYLMQGNGPGNAPTVSTTLKDPCHSSVYGVFSSAFGTVNPYAYEDGCQQGNDQIRDAITVGIDHLLGYFAGGYDTVAQDTDGDGIYEVQGDPDPFAVAGDGYDSRTRVDGDNNCTTAYPNTLQSDTGLDSKMLRCAMLSMPNGPNADLCLNEYPRLQQGLNVQSDYLVVEEIMDNVPPWEYLRPAADLHADAVPSACVILAASRGDDSLNSMSTFAQYQSFTDSHPSTWDDPSAYDQYDRYELFVECLDEWDVGLSGPADAELFTDEIGRAARFAFIPQVAEETITSSQQLMHIEGFLPVYLYRLYVKTQGQQNGTAQLMCDPLDPRSTDVYLVHDAGQTESRYSKNGTPICGDTNDALSRLAAVALACGMVSDVLCDKDTNQPKNAGGDIYEFRLSK